MSLSGSAWMQRNGVTQSQGADACLDFEQPSHWQALGGHLACEGGLASRGPETPEGEGGADHAAELSSVAASLPGGLG